MGYSSINNIAKSTGIVLSLTFAASVIGYLFRLYLARSLSLSDYGLFYAVLVFIGFFSIGRDFGLNTALVKFIPEFLAKKQTKHVKSSILFVSAAQLLLALVIATPIFLLSDILAVSYFGTAAASFLVKIILLSFIASFAMSMLQATLQGFQKMSYFALVEPLRLSLVFLITFSFISLGVVGAAYGYLAAPVIVSGVLFFLLLKEFPFFKVKAQIDKALVKKIVFFGFPVFVASIGSVMIGYADTIILTASRSLREVGLYQAALPTSQLLWFFIGGIGSVLLPAVSSLWSRNRKEDISNGILILTKILFVLMMPIIVIFISFPELILRNLFGDPFVAASQSLQILSIGAVFYTFYFMFNMVLIGVGRPKIHTAMYFISGVFGIVLNMLLIPGLGIVGASIATTTSYAFGMTLSSIYLRRLIPIKFPASGMAKAFLGGAMVLLLIFLLKSVFNADPLLKIFVCGIVSVAAYSVFALKFIINKGDLKLLSDIGIRIPKFLNDRLMKVVKN